MSRHGVHKTTQTAFRLPEGLLAWLREQATAEDRTMATIVIDALEAYRRGITLGGEVMRLAGGLQDGLGAGVLAESLLEDERLDCGTTTELAWYYHNLGGNRMDKYTTAMTSSPCPRKSCPAGVGQVCNTTAIVHAERRDAALAQGLWDPGKALAGEYGDLAGCPLEALKPVSIRRGRPKG